MIIFSLVFSFLTLIVQSSSYFDLMLKKWESERKSTCHIIINATSLKSISLSLVSQTTPTVDYLKEIGRRKKKINLPFNFTFIIFFTRRWWWWWRWVSFLLQSTIFYLFDRDHRVKQRQNVYRRTHKGIFILKCFIIFQ